VQVILDGRKSNSTQIILGYINKIVSQYNVDLLSEKHQMHIPTVLVQRNWFNPNLIYQWFTVPGLVAILAMTTSLSVTALSISREKRSAPSNNFKYHPHAIGDPPWKSPPWADYWIS
jgi:ABC-2 type transport system permease protein